MTDRCGDECAYVCQKPDGLGGCGKHLPHWRKKDADKQAASAPASPGWMPIETAPKDGTRMLAWIEWFDGPEATAGRFQGSDFWPDNRTHESKMPTHWMPLPAAPKETQP